MILKPNRLKMKELDYIQVVSIIFPENKTYFSKWIRKASICTLIRKIIK